MRYRVTGQNKNTGARMILEFEAESKALAERKANNEGMSVNRVEDITDGYVSKATDPHPRAGRRSGGGGMLVPLLILVGIAVAIWYFRDKIPFLHH